MTWRVGVARALAILRRGGVVAFPTETFYALGVDPRKPAALRRLRRIKGRARRKPILLLAASRAQALALAAAPPPAAKLARLFWPGPLTLVLPPRHPRLARALGSAGGLAVRVPSHPLARRLVRAYGFPLTGTSANRSGAPPARQATHLRRALGAALDGVIDGGRTPGGAPSTVLDLCGPRARLLRRGAVPSRRLQAVLRPKSGGRKDV